MAAGERIPNSRTARRVDEPTSTIPTRRFQPAWKLGIAAYSFTSDGGSSCR
jgi:hypothetical protein